MVDAGPQTSAVSTPQALQQTAWQVQHIPQLNWSHFKPEFLGKLEDAEAHLLWMNDWINTHQFQKGVKSKDFV